MDFKLTTPVVFMIFNRPDTTLKVFERIRQAKPTKLFLIADGARDNKPGEAEKVQQCRDIVRKIDWKCKVHLNFAEKNMGCKNRVYSGISWVFEHVEEAIILEDDCLPSMSFFRFCQELLEKYRYDTRVNVISGSNHDWVEDFEGSYTFANRLKMWGWATWKRAWKLCDIDMKIWQECRTKEYLKKICLNDLDFVRSTNEFQSTFEGKIDTWDYQFALANYLNHGLDIIPKNNMIRNLGFGADATHTFDRFSKEGFYIDEETEFPLGHPNVMLPFDRIGNEEIFRPAPTQQEFQEEFQLRDNHFKQLIQSGKFSAAIDYFKDTLRNAKFFRPSYVYWLSTAYLMVGDYPHSLQLAEELLDSGAIPPQAFTQFVGILLSQKRVEDAFMILDKILSKFQNIDERLKNEIVAIVQANQNILESGKYTNIEKFI